MTKDYFAAKFPTIAHLKKIVKTIEKIAIKNIGIKQ
jgi:hypothetical protein